MGFPRYWRTSRSFVVCETGTGTTSCGPSRGGKCEIRGVLGGGTESENSDASEESCVAVGESAMRKFTGGSAERRETID